MLEGIVERRLDLEQCDAAAEDDDDFMPLLPPTPPPLTKEDDFFVSFMTTLPFRFSSIRLALLLMPLPSLPPPPFAEVIPIVDADAFEFLL
jgi:hypothetical protein